MTTPSAAIFNLACNDRTVVGVVGDIRVRGLERASEPQVYLPYQQASDGELVWYAPKELVVRARDNAAELLPSIRRIVAGADSEQPISNVHLLSEVVAGETAPRATQLRLLGAFAALAFLLAAIGIHGLLSSVMSQRAREIGVRVALGAGPGDILGMVFRRGLGLAIAGALPGLALAYAAGRMVQALLAGVSPADAATFLSAAGLSLVMTLAGSLWPALRAVAVDPIAVIRSE